MGPRVVFADRALTHNVGGNSTYIRALYEGLREDGFRYEPAGLGAATGLRAAIEEASMVTRSSTADVFHYPTDTGGVMRATGHRPVVSTIHGVASRHIPAVRSLAAERIWRSRVMRTARISERVITVSRTSATDIEAVFGIEPSRIHVIPHGIDHRRFRPDVDTSVLSDLFPDLPDSYYLYLGNLDPRKNVTSLVQAVNCKRIADLGVHLVIAGREAWGVEDLVALIDETPNVLWLRQVPDEAVAPLMAKSRAFIFPSRYEGFGFPVLEAAACGTVVATTRKGALSDIADGLSLDLGEPTPDNIADCVLHIEQLQDSERRALTSAAIEQAKQFTWSRSIEMHREVFEAVA
jgi:glycosyltransferase involved in cell wall biosynthesis